MYPNMDITVYWDLFNLSLMMSSIHENDIK